MNSKCLAQVLESKPALNLDQLALQLEGNLAGRVRDFQLLHHDQGIVLRGLARTYHAKQLAQHAVMKETLVPIWANEIEVR
jgi:hypothetical protein